ncbi:hypothetical protein PENTCL1PPCAC_3803, partial [Pristionchus entomophagus]
ILQVTRQLFFLSGTPFEDARVVAEEWKTLKESEYNSAFNKLPFLEIDDRVLPQSSAINRYLANLFGFAGKTPFESARIDALADQFKDYWTELVPFMYAMYSKDKDPVAFEEKKKEVAIPARDKLFGILEKEYKVNGSTGFLVGDSVSWVDLLIADHVDVIENVAPGFCDGFSGLKEHHKTVTSIPKLREWLKTRPQNKH